MNKIEYDGGLSDTYLEHNFVEMYGENPDWKKIALHSARGLTMLMLVIADDVPVGMARMIVKNHIEWMDSFYRRHPNLDYRSNKPQKTPKSDQT